MTPQPTLPTSMGPTPSGTRFVRRLGPHHFAHLRACAEGLGVADCARRYLGIAHGHEAKRTTKPSTPWARWPVNGAMPLGGWWVYASKVQ